MTNHASNTTVPLRLRWFSESRALIALAVPLIGSQLFGVLAGLIDTVMSGRAGAAEQAVVGLGVAIWIPVGVSLMSVVQAISPIVASHVGAQDRSAIVRDTHQALWLALILGFIPMLALPWAKDLMWWAGVPADLIGKTGLFLQGIVLGLPAMLMFRALAFYSASLNHPGPTLVLSALGLLVNAALNYVLISGRWGWPALGGAGCGWASGVGMWLSFLAMALFVLVSPRYRGVRVLTRLDRPRWAVQLRLLRLGLPMGGSTLAEVAAFTGVALLVAPLGSVAIAAHQSGLNLVALVFMLYMGLSSAISIRVGQAVGAQDRGAAGYTARTGVSLALIVALAISPLLVLSRHAIAAMYSSDPQVRDLTGQLILIASVWQWADATQVCAIGALRGYHITFAPMVLVLIAYWVVAIPLGYVLGHAQTAPLGLQPSGLFGFWMGLLSGLVFVALTLLLMLRTVIRRHRV